MPRSRMQKVDILARMYKLKTALYESQPPFDYFSEEKKEGAHIALNKVLDILDEYRV